MKVTKKILTLGVLSMGIAPLAVVSCGSEKETTYFESENFRISSKGEVMGFADSNYEHSGILTIKEKYESIQIKSIANNAFKDKKNINELTLPEKLITIGNEAFANNSLSSINIPNSTTIIGNNAFANNLIFINKNINLPTQFNTNPERLRMGIRTPVNLTDTLPAMSKEEVNKIVFGNGPKTSERFNEFLYQPSLLEDSQIIISQVQEVINNGGLSINRSLASQTLLRSSINDKKIPVNLVFDSLVLRMKNQLPSNYKLVCSEGKNWLDNSLVGMIHLVRISDNIQVSTHGDITDVLKTNLIEEDQNWINQSTNLIDEENVEEYKVWRIRMIDLSINNTLKTFYGEFGWHNFLVQLYNIGIGPLSTMGELGYYFTPDEKIMCSFTAISDIEKVAKLQRELEILQLEGKPTDDKQNEIMLLAKEYTFTTEITIDTKIPVTVNTKSTFDTLQELETYNSKTIAEKIQETFEPSEQFNWNDYIIDIIATKTIESWSFQIVWELTETPEWLTQEVYKTTWSSEFGRQSSVFLYDFLETITKLI